MTATEKLLDKQMELYSQRKWDKFQAEEKKKEAEASARACDASPAEEEDNENDIEDDSFDYVVYTHSVAVDEGPAEENVMTFAPTRREPDEYSDAGSLTDVQETYANMLQNELLQDLDTFDLAGERFVPLLSDNLKEFAIRLGHEKSDKDHQDMKYLVHKGHEQVKTPSLPDWLRLTDREKGNCSSYLPPKRK